MTNPNSDTAQSGNYMPSILQPASSENRFVETDSGLKLHYLDYGGAGKTPMLCIHGGGAHGHWFDFVADAFTSDHHVLALDLPGHGDSTWIDPPDYSYERFAGAIADFVAKLDLRDFTLMGHSMGGLVSLVYASMYPGKIGKLVVIDSRPKLNEEFVERMHTRAARKSRVYTSLDEYTQSYRLRPEGTTASPELIRYLGSFASRHHDDGTWQHKFDRNVYAHRKLVDGMACWKKIKIPALLVRGLLSPRITDALYAEMHALCPQLELASVANSHHHVTIDQPEAFKRVVRTFLDAHSADKAHA